MLHAFMHACMRVVTDVLFMSLKLLVVSRVHTGRSYIHAPLFSSDSITRTASGKHYSAIQLNVPQLNVLAMSFSEMAYLKPFVQSPGLNSLPWK